MTKQNDISDATYSLPPQAYENLFNVYEDNDGFYYYNLLRTINFPIELDTSSYTEYEVVRNDTWQYIAWKAYRNVRLWWIIVSANQILDPTSRPEPGIKLKIIKPEVVRNLLNIIKNDS